MRSGKTKVEKKFSFYYCGAQIVIVVIIQNSRTVQTGNQGRKKTKQSAKIYVFV